MKLSDERGLMFEMVWGFRSVDDDLESYTGGDEMEKRKRDKVRTTMRQAVCRLEAKY